jgi:hypothetical protein
MLAALLLAQVPVPDRATEVTVIGQRLRAWRGTVRSQGGKVACRTQRSTGDKEIDAIGCTALTACSTPMEGRLIALAQDKSLSPPARKTAQAKINAELGRCMAKRHDAMIQALADRRYAARIGA